MVFWLACPLLSGIFAWVDVGDLFLCYCVLNYYVAFMAIPAQSCAPGSVCCQNLNRCDDPGCYGQASPNNNPDFVTVTTSEPPEPIFTPPPNACTGKPNNAIICKSPTTFNLCWSGGKIMLELF